MAKVLAIANGKGGVAKTTSAISLSAVLSERFQLLLVDADPQASASSWAERGEMPFDIATETDPALLVDLRQAEGYELVVVDTPPARESAELKTVVSAADYVVMPTLPNTLDLTALIQTIKANVAPLGIPYRVLLTRVDARAVKEAREAQQTLMDAGIPSFNAFIYTSKSHELAARKGQPITRLGGKTASAAARDYRLVADELLREWRKNG